MIPHAAHWVTEDDIDAVARVLRGGSLTRGSAVADFEGALADYCGARYCVCCSSGTMALYLACRAAGLRSRQRVVVPANTFIATANAPLVCGADIWVADIDPETWLIGDDLPHDGAEALIAVDYGGVPCDYQRLRHWCDKHGAFLIADSCHSLGGAYRGQMIGGVDGVDMTCLSFHPAKTITTGEGGAVLTNSDALDTRLRWIRDNGRPGGVGLNGHMSDISAALGHSQLARIDEILERRVALADAYRDALGPIDGVALQRIPDDVDSSCHIMPVWVGDMARAARSALLAEGVSTRQMYLPLVSRPRADAFYGGCVVLPLYPTLQAEQVRTICDTLRAAMLVGGSRQ